MTPFGHDLDVALAAAFASVCRRIRTCPHCGTLFLKQGKQAYCSNVCGQKVRWARFIAHRPDRDYRRERRQARRA
jgi:uncharacterized Zn finger protein (UPF0148 family)